MSEICDGLRAPEVLDRIPGLTYRKLDYWRRTGRINAHTHHPGGETGTGIHFCWPMSEVRVCALILQFATYGFELEGAANLARHRESMVELARILTEALDAETVT